MDNHNNDQAANPEYIPGMLKLQAHLDNYAKSLGFKGFKSLETYHEGLDNLYDVMMPHWRGIALGIIANFSDRDAHRDNHFRGEMLGLNQALETKDIKISALDQGLKDALSQLKDYENLIHQLGGIESLKKMVKENGEVGTVDLNLQAQIERQDEVIESLKQALRKAYEDINRKNLIIKNLETGVILKADDRARYPQDPVTLNSDPGSPPTPQIQM